MAQSIGFLNVLPDSFARYSPASTTQAVQRKQEVIFNADQSTNGFQFGNNSVIQINVQSNSEVMIGMETYLEFDLTVAWKTLIAFGYDPAANHFDKNLRMEMGGGHALFNKLEVKTNVSAQTVSLRELYNTEYVLESRTARVPSIGLSNADLDGFEQESINTGTFSGYQCGYQTNVAGTAVAGANTLVGAFIDYNGPWRPVSALADAIDRTALVTTADVFVGYLASVPTTTSDYKQRVRLRLNDPFLQQNLPLFLMPNGIQISLTLESPCRVFYSMPYEFGGGTRVVDASSNTPGDTKILNETYVGWNYKIENPRICAMMVQPSEDQIARYTQEYRSPQGLLFPCPGYRVLRTQTAAVGTSKSISMLPGCRSLRYAVGGFFNSTVQMANGSYATRSPLVNHSHIPFYPGTDYYSWNIGSTQFPSFTQNISHGNNASAKESFFEGITVLIKRLQLVFGTTRCELMEYYRSPLRILYPPSTYSWDANNAALTSTFAYPGWFAQDFSRDNGPNAKLTGIDCSVTPLEFRIKFMGGVLGLADATAASQTWPNNADTFEFIVFAFFDQWVKIGLSETIVLN